MTLTLALSDGRVLYQAQEAQDRLHQCAAPHVLFGGAAGGGKSVALRWHLITACLQYAGIKCLLLRRQFTELEQTHLLALQAEVPKELATYDAGRHRLTFPNGSILQFGHCNTDNDFASYLSTEWALIAVDEAGQFTPYMLTMLPSRLRTTLKMRTQFVLASNPGGPAHQWLYERFIERHSRDGTVYHPEDYAFLPSSVRDNQYIQPEYVRRLEVLPDLERRRYLDGDWNLPTGNVFAELDRQVHLVPFSEWPDAKRVVAADWGWDAPAPALWFQADMGLDGEPTRHNVYREWAPTETLPADWAQTVIELSAEETIERVILDSAAWASPQDGGPSPAEQMAPYFRRAGMRLMPSNKGRDSVVKGIYALHAYFQPDRNGVPALTISDTCPGLWDALVTLQRGDPLRLNDPRAADKPAPRQSQLHYADACRYYIQSRPRSADVPLHEWEARDPLTQALKADERSLQVARMQRAKAKGMPLLRARDVFKKPPQRKYPWVANG